jgi:GTPase involved in cell partitioning and DNA repair
MFKLINRSLVLLASIAITHLTHGASDNLQQQINELKAVNQQQKIESEAAINKLENRLKVVQSMGMVQLKKQKEEAEKALSKIKNQLSEAQAQIAALTKSSKEKETPESTEYQTAQAALKASSN